MSDRWLRAALRLLMRLTLKPSFAPWVPFALQRAAFELTRLTTRATPGASIRPESPGGVAGECVAPARGEGGAPILYLHGGGYCIGSPRTHRPVTTALAVASGAMLHVPDYRLAPEHPFPAALDDALAAYRALLAQAGEVVVAGDSAGGGLALALALAARDAGLRLPAGLLLISPWVDLACTGESMTTRAARDPLLNRAAVRHWAQAYAPGREQDPRCSPLLGELRGLPPVLIQLGSDETLYDDAARLRERLAAAGVAVQLTEYAGLWHDFQLNARVVRDPDRAVAELAAFARSLPRAAARAAEREEKAALG